MKITIRETTKRKENMGLKNIFQMTKTDRYTQDGRDELAKLQETEDVTYKTGDISQKTGLQKQPDGSWAPPKNGAKAGKQSKPAAKPTTEELSTFKDIVREFKKNPSKQTEQIMNEAKSHLMKNRGMTPEQLGKIGREVMAESKPAAEKKPSIPTDKEVSHSLDELSNSKEMASKVIGGVKVTYNPENGFYKVTHKAPGGQEVSRGCSDILEAQQAVMFRLDRIKKGEIPAISESSESKPTDKYKDLPGAQKKDALYASTFEGISIGQTQNQMERQGWELISTGEETGENVNVYAKPDGSKVTMKHDGKTITSTEYEAPGSTESKAWADRSKNERTATLVDWLDDWDKHPEEKNDAAYAAIEKELATRGVNRASRQDAKKADNAGRNEFYRRAYEGDAAPRQLTGDCRIRIRKEKPKLTGDTKIRIRK